MPNLLVELGTEELPVGVLDVIYNDLKTKTEETLRKSRLSFTSVKTEATPRRIALYIEGLAGRQEDEVLELSGPSLEKAFSMQPENLSPGGGVAQSKMVYTNAVFGGKAGIPTPALEGFLKSKEATLEDIIIKETPRGRFVVVNKKNIGKPVASVLAALLQELFTSLNFPKNMRWEKTGFRFPRPIRWVVALLDKKIVSFEFCGLKASNKSYGHRFLSPKTFTVLSADWNAYRKALLKAHVILDLEARKAFIAKALQSEFKQKSFDEELLHTTAQLAEEPFLFEGGFAKEYLELPEEVLASCMKKNQKIFACYGNDGKLTGKFVAILNGKRSGLDRIRKGYENVLESRLKDARYFYKADTKEPFEGKLQLLEQVTYLGKLGNMKQKAERMEKLALHIAIASDKGALGKDLQRAARLSKIDLMTHLVYEFPDLQGIVGREYSAASDEKKEVALAIGAQYLPQSLSVDYKELKTQINELGALLGIVDRMDLLVGAFGTGIQPTGSQDPFALRRAGGVVVKILRAFPSHLSLRKTIEASAKFYDTALTLPLSELTDKLMRFFEERFVFELQVKPGTREYEILQAVIRSNFDDLSDVFERYERLTELYKKEPEAFIKTAKVVERTANITKGVKEFTGVSKDLLTEPSEKTLFEVLNRNSEDLKALLDARSYGKVTVKFGESFYKPLNEFFEQVMVNAEDMKIRANRQALMRQINRLYSERVADLSVLSRLDQG